MKICFLFLVAVSSYAQAAVDLGKALTFKTHSNGKPHVGIAYAYGDDIDGPSYAFTYLPVVPAAESGRKLRWNFYQRSTDKFLLSWAAQRSVSLSVLQAQLSGEIHGSVIQILLQGQNPTKDEVFFVLADQTNRPLYNVSITQLCKDQPRSFSDLTYGHSCDDAKL